MNPASAFARIYFSFFPLEKGKWRAWEWFRRTTHYRDFPPGAYRTNYGFSMNLGTNDQIDRFVYFWRCWEPNETWLIRTLLRPGDVFIDVGANAGYYSLLASRLVGPAGRVLSVEPIPLTLGRLKANIALNGFGNIRIIEAAASDETGEIVLTMPESGQAGMTTVRQVKGSSWRVKCDRLDRLLGDVGASRLVKVDVEGAELRALRGLQGLLVKDNAPDVLCEVTPSYLAQIGDSAEALCSWMSGLDYRGYLLKGRAFDALAGATFPSRHQESVFFTKRPFID